MRGELIYDKMHGPDLTLTRHMNLPNGDRAVVDDQKLWGYVLNHDHPHGSQHAFLFKRLLGIDLSNWQVLRDALLAAARDGEATPGKPSEFGEKFEIRFPMEGSRGRYTILSVWFVPRDDAIPRLVTAYVE